MAEHLDDLLSLRNRWSSGFAATTNPASLNVTFTTGVAIVGGFRIGIATDPNVVKSLSPNAVNHVWLDANADFVINTSGTPPAGDSVKLYTFTTDGSGVTATSDLRSSEVSLDVDFEAENVEARTALRAINALLSGATPFLEGHDTVTGQKRRLWWRSSKLQVTDEAGAVLTDNLANIDLSSLQARSEKDQVNGYAGLGAGGLLSAAQLPAATETAKGAVELADAAPPALHATTGTKGTSTDAAKEDHQHAHGDLSAGGATPHHEFTQMVGAITDTQHGSRGGAALHPGATSGAAGFMSAADKATLDAATDAATVSTLVKRDGAGRAKFAAPAAATDAAIKSTVDDHAALTAPHSATSAATADRLMLRDAAGRSKAAAASVAGDVLVHGQVAGVNGAGALRGTYPNPDLAQDYAGVDATVLPSVGAVLSQGMLSPASQLIGTTGASAALPGVVSTGFGNTGQSLFILTPSQTEFPASAGNESGQTGIPLGTKLFVKGIYKELIDAVLDANFPKFGLGVAFGGVTTNIVAFFGHDTETTRDDNATVAVVVDDTVDENIQSYNNAAAGDASFTDSGFNAALASGTDFEMIVEVPSTTDSDNDVLVTIRIRDSVGTLRTIFSAAVPASTATGDRAAYPVLMMNQKGVVYNLVYKVERAS